MNGTTFLRKSWLDSPVFERIFLALVLFVVLLGTIRDYQWGSELRNGELHSKINNYHIFSHAFTELQRGGNLYSLHPEFHYDYYKYSPAFAVLMAPFESLPDFIGLLLWNLLNLFCVYFGLKLLPGLDRRQVVTVLLISAMELIGSIMNEQSNGLMAGLSLLFVAFLERNRPFWAILFIVLSLYIKLYSGLFLILLLTYPGFWRNAAFTVFWFLFFAFLPLLFVNYDQWMFLYDSWFDLLQSDHQASYGYSVLGILNSWFNLDVNKLALTAGGWIAMMLPMTRFRLFHTRSFRYELFSALLIWVIIFNHKAESPAFVVAMTGIGLWYAVRSHKRMIDHILLIFAMVFVSVAFSDLTPRAVREGVFYAYSLKALPCLVIWLYLTVGLLTGKSKVQ